MANTIKALAAAKLPGAPLHNGRAATLTELTQFNRAWRRLLSLRRRTGVNQFGALLANVGLIYCDGKIREGEQWEIPEPDTMPTLQKGRKCRELADAFDVGGPLHNNRTATIRELKRFSVEWLRLLEGRESDVAALEPLLEPFALVAIGRKIYHAKVADTALIEAFETAERKKEKAEQKKLDAEILKAKRAQVKKANATRAENRKAAEAAERETSRAILVSRNKTEAEMVAAMMAMINQK